MVNLKEEEQKTIEKHAGDLDEAIEAVTKNPRSLKAWVKLAIAIAGIITAIASILKAFGVI